MILTYINHFERGLRVIFDGARGRGSGSNRPRNGATGGPGADSVPDTSCTKRQGRGPNWIHQ